MKGILPKRHGCGSKGGTSPTLPQNISHKDSHYAQTLAENNITTQDASKAEIIDSNPEIVQEVIKENSETLVIESNRYRNKTMSERSKEAYALEKIEKELAKARMKAGEKNPVQNSSQGKVREIVSKAVGTSHDTLRKVEIISKKKPELMYKLSACVIQLICITPNISNSYSY